MNFSEGQKKAIKRIEGQTLLIACAGSGKTTTIIYRIKNMVDHGVSPSSMLNITFTKNAAEEMEKRFHAISDIKVSFSTIHAFCYRILCDRYRYSAENILKQSEAWTFISRFFRKAGIAPNKIDGYVKEAMSGITCVKSRRIRPSEYQVDKLTSEQFVQIFEMYEEYKESLNKIDFDDMLLVFNEKLESDDSLLPSLKERYKYITIDEFQDTNDVQAEIFYKIAGDNGNIFVVGDDDQSIYSFRGAESQIMLDFPKHFPNCEKITIDTNYRCGENIVSAAANVIQYNKNRFDKSLNSSRKGVGIIKGLPYTSASGMTGGVTRKIKQLIDGGEDPNNIAVLYRVNTQAMPFASSFIKSDIPFYTTERIPSIHEDPIFADVEVYYRLANGNERKGDLQRILNRPSRYLKSDNFKNCSFDYKEMIKCASGLKPFAIEKIRDLFYDVKTLKERDPDGFMRYIELGMEYNKFITKNAEYYGRDAEEDFNTFKELREEAANFSSMEEWMAYVERYERNLRESSKVGNKDGVCLSTFHGAKGLEWKHVFIIGANKDYCPYKKATTMDALEEERRMFYVAMTRAKDFLNVCYVHDMGGKWKDSPYINEAKLIAN